MWNAQSNSCVCTLWLGIRKAGNYQCGIKSPDWRAKEWEAAFDIHAKSSQTHLYSSGAKWKDTWRWKESFYSTDQRRNIARLSDMAKMEICSMFLTATRIHGGSDLNV